MGCELLRLRNMLEELDVEIKLRILGDSSPLQGLLERRGTGRVKHIEMKQLWLQSKVRSKDLEYMKIPRKYNPSDAGTHHWTRAEGHEHFGALGIATWQPGEVRGPRSQG
jgi:hypothetical protein